MDASWRATTTRALPAALEPRGEQQMPLQLFFASCSSTPRTQCWKHPGQGAQGTYGAGAVDATRFLAEHLLLAHSMGVRRTRQTRVKFHHDSSMEQIEQKSISLYKWFRCMIVMQEHQKGWITDGTYTQSI